MRIYLVGAGVISRTHVEAARKLPESVEFRVMERRARASQRRRSYIHRALVTS